MKFRSLIFVLLFSSIVVCAAEPQGGTYQNLIIRKICVSIENQAPGDVDESLAVLHRLQTREGESFDQEAFDRDLKNLTAEYDWVEPRISVENNQITVQLDIKKRPSITSFEVEGSSFKKNKILKEGELSRGMVYNRDNFYQAIHKIRDFYIKKGFFKVEVSYTMDKVPNANEVAITIQVNEGPKGRINKIVYKGFSKEEESEISNLIRTHKFSIITSWLTGTGTIKEEEFAQDTQMIVGHLQNKGYVDAHATMKLDPLPRNQLALVITLDRGEKYKVHNISFSGETLYKEEEIKDALTLKSGDVFSMDKVRVAQEKIKELYTKDGYLHTNVDYTLTLLPETHEYDINFSVEESEQYRVGLVMISGNYCTTKNVVYNNIDLEPGEVFDNRKLKSTQKRLQSTGYFKNVNVYPIKCQENVPNAPDYCDVMVEVNEAQTGNMSLFVGASSTDSVFGGVDLTENNFNIAGFRNLWSEGPCALRGGGQYFQAKAQVGAKETDVGFTWMDPYFNDSLWRFSVDFNYNFNKIISKNYNLHAITGAIGARYPVSPNFSYGYRFRVKDSIVRVNPKVFEPEDQKKDVDSAEEAKIEAAAKRDRNFNSGVVAGVAGLVGYDTTDNALKPHRGFRSNFEGEFAGLYRRVDTYSDFPFIKLGYLNSYYFPIWSKGTLKTRTDFKFIELLMGGEFEALPLTERFFLGGEGTVRGYAPAKIGPAYEDNSDNPKGGISSMLLSVEYLQNIAKPLDAFVFFDSGAISDSPFSMGKKLYMSTGAGVRIDIGRQLPLVVGVGFPLNPDNSDQVSKVFFSMAGEF